MPTSFTRARGLPTRPTCALGRLLLAVSALWLGALPAAASAATSPYVSNTTGYDASYPNCATTQPPTAFTADFAIVGVGGGRPFSASSCAQSEWGAASSAALATSLYFNTGYSGAYSRDVAATCVNEVGAAGVFGGLTRHELSRDQGAWEVGCSEVLYAQGVIGETPAVWWADVETANSWAKNTSLNQFALDGMSYAMGRANLPGGFYSSPAMWRSITGSTSWAPSPAASGVWVAGGSPSSCRASAFAGAPTWLYQSGTSGGLDVDVAC